MRHAGSKGLSGNPAKRMQQLRERAATAAAATVGATRPDVAEPLNDRPAQGQRLSRNLSSSTAPAPQRLTRYNPETARTILLNWLATATNLNGEHFRKETGVAPGTIQTHLGYKGLPWAELISAHRDEIAALGRQGTADLPTQCVNGVWHFRPTAIESWVTDTSCACEKCTFSREAYATHAPGDVLPDVFGMFRSHIENRLQRAISAALPSTVIESGKRVLLAPGTLFGKHCSIAPDLVLPELKVAIEHDGADVPPEFFPRGGHTYSKRLDVERDLALEAVGWRTIRLRTAGLPELSASPAHCIEIDHNSTKRMASEVVAALQEWGFTV